MQKHAYLNIDDANSPIYELAEHVILPEFGEIIVTPNPKFGEPSTWTNLDEFRNAVMNGKLHPLDAKFGIADGISRGLEKVSTHFTDNPDLLDQVTAIINRK